MYAILRRSVAARNNEVTRLWKSFLRKIRFSIHQQGRLKLRVLSEDKGQLIYYIRPDQDGPKRSDYHLSLTSDPKNLKRVLELAYGIRGVIRKTRYLYLVGQTRVHLDDVEGLGQFMELEVVLREGQSDAEGQAIAEGLMTALGVERSDLLEGAYMDLLKVLD